MSRLVCIHGIAQEYKSTESVLNEWLPSLQGGVSNAHGDLRLAAADVEAAFYGLHFRPAGKKSAGLPPYKAADLEDDPLEVALLTDMFDALVPAAQGGSAKKAGAVSRTVAGMLQALATTPLFGEAAQRLVIWHLKQVRRYLTEPKTRGVVQQSLKDRIGRDTQVVVAHSLGSVAAYEVLCEHPEYPVRTLITLGSPLGMPAMLPRLLPPVQSGKGRWPGGLERWINVADSADIVALRKDLRPIYGDRLEDFPVNNGATMHDVQPYLTAPETGDAIARGLGLIP